MTAPNPAEFAADIRDIIDTLARGVTVGEGQPVSKGGTYHRESLDQAYRWFHGAAYAQRAGGEATSRLCPVCGGKSMEPRCEACTPRDHNDVGEIVLTHGHLMRILETQISEPIARALALVKGAVAASQTIATAIDKGTDRTIRSEWPPGYDDGDIKRAREAKRRRLERGDDIPA